MRAYLVSGGNMRRYAATQGEAKEFRDEIVEAAEIKKKDVEIEQVEIPVAKAELLAFINELATELDFVEVEEEAE